MAAHASPNTTIPFPLVIEPRHKRRGRRHGNGSGDFAEIELGPARKHSGSNSARGLGHLHETIGQCSLIRTGLR
eukprot:6367380-Pyramimonas_sp.AAC.1